MIDAAVGGERPAIGQVLAFAGAECLRIEYRSRNRPVGPRAARVIMVEPDAHVAVAYFDGVLRERIFQRRGQRVRGANLQDRLAVDPLAVDVVEIVGTVLRHFVNVGRAGRSEEHTSELQSLMRNSYAVFCLTTKK